MKVKDLIHLLYKVDSEAEICFRPLSEEFEDLPIGNVLTIKEYSAYQEDYEPIKTTILLLEQTEKTIKE